MNPIQKIKTTILLLGVAGLLTAGPAFAACPLTDPADCIYVADDPACNDGGTGTQSVPFCTIQAAVDQSVINGTNPSNVATILVMPGSYNECITAGGDNPPCDCCTKNGTGGTGCDCPSCEADVCALDSFCCDSLWDGQCDNIASSACTCCDFHDAGTCVDNFQDAPVNIIADHWLESGSPNPDPSNLLPFESVALSTTVSGNGVCDGNANPRAPVLTITGSGASVQGLAITGGGDSGVKTRGSVSLSNLLLFGNESELGGGARLDTDVCLFGDVNASLSRSVVRNNIADDFSEIGSGDGGGLFIFANGSEPDVGCVGGTSNVTVSHSVFVNNSASNLVIDTLENDTFAAGGAISAETTTGIPVLDPALSQAHVEVHDCTFDSNQAAAGDGFALGGAISATTFGFGSELIEIWGNTVGPGNTATSNAVAAFGGGISGSVTPFIFGLHDMRIYGNEVFQNSSDFGAGMDLLVDAIDLDVDQIARLTASNNEIHTNGSTLDGAGLNAQINASRAVDTEHAPDFPAAPLIAEEISLLIESNTIRDNFAGAGGGAGATLQADANADPENLGPLDCTPVFVGAAAAELDFRANLVHDNFANGALPVPGCSDNICEEAICAEDSFCCTVEWDSTCADLAALSGTCFFECPPNGSSNCCDPAGVPPQAAVGAGILARMVAKGDALARVNVETSTLVGNQMSSVGFTGGVEAVSVTIPDCERDDVGRAELVVNRSIVEGNDFFGVGGPLPEENDLTVTVTRSSVYDNGGNGSAQQYETSIFPGGAPAGNLVGDPLLDVAYVPALCTVNGVNEAYAVGSCASDPSTICFDDSDCGVECIPEGAGYIASPDVNGDGAVDGVDLMRVSAAFGARRDLNARYNPDTDLDRNGIVDGPDLPFIAPLFGVECLAGQ